MKKLTLMASALSLLMATVGAHAADDVEIGFIQPTKSLLGEASVKAAETAVAMINEQGGVLDGRNVRLVIYDDNFSPVDGVAAVQRLTSQDGIKLVAGLLSSTVALAMIPIIEAENALLMASVPKHTDVTQSGYENVFRLNTTTAMDAVVLNQYIKEVIKPEKLAFIGENNDYGRQNLDLLSALVGEVGGEVVSEGLYAPNEHNDFNSMITNAKGAGADTLFISGAKVEQYANIVRSLGEMGFDPDHVILSSGILNNEFVKLAGPNAEGVMSADIYLSNFPGELNNAFVARFQEMHGYAPEKIEELNFEAIWVLAKAIEKAGTADDVDKISDVLREGTWETPRGTLKFSENGQAQADAFLVVVTDGVITRQ